jgi:signal transduction histidine kinase
LETINGLLDLAKIEAGHLDVHPEPTSLAAFVPAVLASLQPLAVRRGLHLRLMPGDHSAPTVLADPLLLRQVLLNLLGNALKFTEQGGVEVTLHRHGDQVRIRITDTGIGIAAADLSRLFRPFTQIDGSSTRRYEGSGLGLVIARRMIEAMGGRLTLHSEGPGCGTVAEVSLPLGTNA